MKKLTLLGIILLHTTYIYGQINMADSTVQVIGYWDNNEKQSYRISYDKYKLINVDTTSREYLRYDVDITIIDSTANSYTIEWLYRDYSVNTDNLVIQKLLSITEDLKVVIKTDELGVILEVINWEEIKNYIYTSTAMLKKEFIDTPKIDNIINQFEGMFSTKQAIETLAIKEIRQFYRFHGGKYKLGEVINAQIKSPNHYGGNPFDTDLTISLDEINPEDNDSIIRMKQAVDSKQLTDATFIYLSNMASTLDTPLPKGNEFSPLKNESWTASRIHGSGWIIYAVETKEVSMDNALRVEERKIEIL